MAGVPAGAIVGAPGSAPPPGMKLAGYVTMAGPAPNAGMGMAGMGSMMNPMMAASMMRNPMMSGSMPMRYPMMPPGSLGPLGGLGPMGGMGPMGMGGPGMMTPPGMGGMGNMGNMGNMGGMGGTKSGGPVADVRTLVCLSRLHRYSVSQALRRQPPPAQAQARERLPPQTIVREVRQVHPLRPAADSCHD